MMDRGDFEMLSSVIAESAADDSGRRTIAYELADILTTKSDRFDPVLFLRQCQIGEIDPKEVEGWSARLGNRVATIRRKRLDYTARTGKSAEIY